MNELIRFFDDIVTNRFPMHIDISYSKTTDWLIKIWRKGVLENASDLIIFYDQDVDIEYLCAKAQVALKDYVIEECGGY